MKRQLIVEKHTPNLAVFLFSPFNFLLNLTAHKIAPAIVVVYSIIL